MLRLTELKLALDHAESALSAAVAERLGVATDDLIDLAVVRRARDARRKSDIALVYSVDVAVRDEPAVLARL